MSQAAKAHTTSRRRFLAALGIAGVSVSAPVAVAVPAPDESKEHFKHPAEYLAAMQAIGWTALAMYQRLDDGSIHRMGVTENASEEVIEATWGKFHAISMRTPVQMAADMPQGHWWSWVWQYLYDKGLRKDVTLTKEGWAS